MKIVKPSVTIESQDWDKTMRRIETKGRVCYKSEDRITDSSANAFMGSLLKRGHLSVLEHSSISVKFIVDRGVSHEIVRHRIASYSQESTRYCNYGNDDDGITVIEPFFFADRENPIGKCPCWMDAMRQSEKSYLELLRLGASAQEARSVLPNSLKTEIWMTANIREWIHFCNLRAAKSAHPQMRQVAIPLLLALQGLLPAIFNSVAFDTDFPVGHYAEVICEEEMVTGGPYVGSILGRLEKQTQKGMEKYGATLDQNPLGLSTAQIVEYALEEVTDLIVYLEKVRTDVSVRS